MTANARTMMQSIIPAVAMLDGFFLRATIAKTKPMTAMIILIKLMSGIKAKTIAIIPKTIEAIASPLDFFINFLLVELTTAYKISLLFADGKMNT